VNQEYQGRCLFNDTRVSTLAESHDEVVGKFDHSVSLLKEQQDRGRRRYGESRLQPSALWSLTGEMEAWKRLGEGHSAEAQRNISWQQHADNFCPVLRVPNEHGAALGAGCSRGVDCRWRGQRKA
jgi:hypothetical protein